MSGFKYFNQQGLTNHGTEDYAAIAMGQRLSPVPFCYSPQCTKESRRDGIRKFVKGYPDACPDCGWAMKWSKVFIDYKSSSAPAE